MQKVLNLYKPVGATPLQLIEALKEKYSEYQGIRLGYAGRLDPMAEGVLLVLVGDENKKRKYYENLQKVYSFDCLFGVTTDTFDTLGLITKTKNLSKEKVEKELPNMLNNISNTTSQSFPAYSSRTVNGKPLFYWARQNLINHITIPTHPIKVYKIRLESIATLSTTMLREYIITSITKVKGNFRQAEILTTWDQYFLTRPHSHIVVRCTITCSSGTYIRSICNDMGGIALRIKRSGVGEYMLKDSLRVQ